MQVTTKIAVDLTRANIGARVNAVQGDGNTRAVEITLLADGKAWTPPEGVEAAISYYQPDGHKGLYNLLADGSAAISMAGNVATIILAPQMLTVSGTVQASLVFNDAKLNRLTTFPFSVSVASNPAAGAQKTEDYLRLQWMEDKLEEYLAAIKASGVFDGKPGDNGVTFTPSVAENGDLSWTNDGGRPNPPTVNIMGPKPMNGVDYGTPEEIAGIAQQAADILGPEVSQIKEDLSDLAPAGAAVGQLFRVAAISEDGKYTMEPVDMLDVRIGETSIVADGVANIPFASLNKYGLAMPRSLDYGINSTSDGRFFINPSTISDVNLRKNQYKPIAPYMLDYAVKAAMCDGIGAAWTAEEQTAARERIGVPGDYELVEDYTITEEDVSCASESGDITIERTAETDGTPYKFDKVFAIILNYTGINNSSVILFDLLCENYHILYSYATIPGGTETISFLPIYENGYVANRWFYDGYFRGRDVPPYRNKICTKVRLIAPFPVGANIKIYGVRA